jgi:uncharacterized protein (TIGR02996 family)
MSPTTDLPHLLAGCKASPLDDTPRLILADWLEDSGDTDRAEFVRLQLLPDYFEDGWTPGSAASQARERRLLKKRVRDWVGGRFSGAGWFRFDDTPAEDEEEAGNPNGRFERGLIKLCGSVSRLLDLLSQLPEHAVPWLETLELRGAADPDAIRQLFARRETEAFTAFSSAWGEIGPGTALDFLDRDHVRRLVLNENDLSEEVVRRLAAAHSLRPHDLYFEPGSASIPSWDALMASPVLSEVRSLDCFVTDETPVLLMLARAKHLTRLTRLYLFGDDFSERPLRALLDSPVVAGLVELQVSGYGDYPAGIARALAASRTMHRLEHLDLGQSAIDDSEVVVLARSPVVERLRSLVLDSDKLSAAGAKALAESPLLANLESLDLSGTGIGDEGLIALAQSPSLRRLRRLSICRCGITDAGVEALASSPYLAQVEELDLSLNPLTPSALEGLAASAHLANLRSLGLWQVRADAASFARLFNSPVVSRLEKLDLQGGALTAEHIKALAESPMLGPLRELILYGNPLQRGVIDTLMEAPWLANLIHLNLNRTGLTDTGIEALTRHASSGQLGDLDLAYNAIGNRGAELLLAWDGLPHLVELSLYENPIDEALVRQIQSVVRGDTPIA